MPIFDRVGSLLVRNGSKGPLHKVRLLSTQVARLLGLTHLLPLLVHPQFGSAPISQIFALDACLISFITILSTKHPDAILFISSSSSLIPELLEKVFKDVRTVWEHDGKEVSRGTREGLKRCVRVFAGFGCRVELISLLDLARNSIVSRLSSTVHLFYYLTCAPSSTLKINEFFTQSPFLGLHDRFTVAFGMLSFASLPDWAEEEEDEGEGRKLVELGCEWLAFTTVVVFMQESKVRKLTPRLPSSLSPALSLPTAFSSRRPPLLTSTMQTSHKKSWKTSRLKKRKRWSAVLLLQRRMGWTSKEEGKRER